METLHTEHQHSVIQNDEQMYMGTCHIEHQHSVIHYSDE